jgi:malonyl-CoA O-methyltransferase
MTAPPPDRDPGAPDARAVRRHFARAAATYDAAAVLQKEIGMRMAERQDVVRLAPSRVLDAGCGTGAAYAELAARYPTARYVALDLAHAMLVAARAKAEGSRSAFAKVFAALGGTRGAGAPSFVCGDLARLPLASNAFDLVWSNLALQWVADLPAALAEMFRVLEVDGLVTFSTFGPDTLSELRAAFAGDGDAHVVRFTDMHDIGDMLVAAGFSDPVMHMERMTMTYAEAGAMMRDLKAIGASNAARARPRGLMGRRRWARALCALEKTRRDGRLPATFEVIYGHAWKVAPTRTGDGHAIVRFERAPRR